MPRSWRARLRAAGLDIPVVVLAYDYREIKNFIARNPRHRYRTHFPVAGQCPHPDCDRQVHRRQAQRPARHASHGRAGAAGGGRQIRYYSSFLPVIYTELIKQSRRVIREGINVAHKLVRMRARPEDSAELELRRCGPAGAGISRLSVRAGFGCASFPGRANSARRPASSWRA